MNFSDALNLIKQGVKLTRPHWGHRGMWVEMEVGNVQYMVINTPSAGRVPWFPDAIDLFAEDWEVVE